MKKYIYNSLKLLIPFVGIFVFAISCSDLEDDDYYTEGGTTLFFKNIDPGIFDLKDRANTFVAFETGQGGDAISNTDYSLTYNGALGVLGPVSLGSGAVPGDLNVTLQEAAQALGVSADDIAIGDSFTFTAATGTAHRSHTVLASCESLIAGECTFKTESYFCDGPPLTGMATLSESGAGEYVFDDWAFGTYQECYGGPASGWGSLKLVDICDQLSISGLDGYGDTWSFNDVSTDGPNLTLSWTNTYGEFGVTVLTRVDEEDWPPLYK